MRTQANSRLTRCRLSKRAWRPTAGRQKNPESGGCAPSKLGLESYICSRSENLSRIGAWPLIAAGIDGEVGPPNLVATARAQACGLLSPVHVRVIQRASTELPLALRATKAPSWRRPWSPRPGQLDPHRLAAAGPTAAGRAGSRSGPTAGARSTSGCARGSFVRNPDGSSDLRAHLTPVGTAIFEAAILPLTAPQPDDAGGRDEREPRQRFHDGLVEGCRRLLAAKEYPG